MPRYRVKDSNHVTHDGKEYPAGDVLDCTEKQAALMPHAVEPVDASEKKSSDKSK